MVLSELLRKQPHIIPTNAAVPLHWHNFTANLRMEREDTSDLGMRPPRSNVGNVIDAGDCVLFVLVLLQLLMFLEKQERHKPTNKRESLGKVRADP